MPLEKNVNDLNLNFELTFCLNSAEFHACGCAIKKFWLNEIQNQVAYMYNQFLKHAQSVY